MYNLDKKLMAHGNNAKNYYTIIDMVSVIDWQQGCTPLSASLGPAFPQPTMSGIANE